MSINILSEQPGRLFAVIILAPYLFYLGCKYSNKFLIFISIIFIIYELFFIYYNGKKKIILSININTKDIN